ncbi:MAG: hypothetical protein A2Y56_09720 [Candidatus Aminicenantes bacterium RBG_13_63_10]|nr:MAG: hypothetical protein A2Y56_09720 [Candidatus Aminicenantes bacterium RBG_13_63_10]
MNRDIFRSAFVPPRPDGRPAGQSRPAGLLFVVLQLVSLFGFAFCLASLWLGMRGVMDLGGFVASGGPYAVAHPAPSFVWIMPVSIWGGLLLLFLNSVAGRRVGGLRLLWVAWPALFLSLGWNFLEYAFRPPGGGGLAWGWLVCGVVFVLMGGVPLLFIIPPLVKSLKRLWSGRSAPGGPHEPLGAPANGSSGRAVRVLFLVIQLAAIALGLYAAQKYFAFLNAPKEAASAVEVGTRPNVSDRMVG